MTRTDMYNAFMLEINNVSTENITSVDVASFLTFAESALFNEIYYNTWVKRTESSSPPMSYEDTYYTSQALDGFKVFQNITTDVFGFFSSPTNLAFYTTIGVYSNETPVQLYEIDELREFEILNNRRNYFNGPKWLNKGSSTLFVKPYNLKWQIENVVDGNGIQYKGIRITPQQQYNIQIRYLVFPIAAQIATPAWENQAYAQNILNGSYPYFATDINSLFPIFLHQRIVRMAVQLYLTSVTDSNGALQEQSLLAKGTS